VGLSKVPSIISVIAMPVIVNVVAPTLGQCDCFGRAGCANRYRVEAQAGGRALLYFRLPVTRWHSRIRPGIALLFHLRSGCLGYKLLPSPK